MKRFSKFCTLIFVLLIISLSATAQEDKEEWADYYPFNGLKVCNLETEKVLEAKTLSFIVRHRFGNLSDGFSTFFGLDNANTQIQFSYGLFDLMHISVARDGVGKTYSGDLKMKILTQSNKKNFSLTGYTSVFLNSEITAAQVPSLVFYDRLSYVTQLIASKKWHSRISTLISPTYIRQNLVTEPEEVHDKIGVGMAGKIHITERVSLNAEGFYSFSRTEDTRFKNPISVSVDIGTYGHVFQLIVSNSQAMNTPNVLVNAEGDWRTGDLFFGFNLSRVF